MLELKKGRAGEKKMVYLSVEKKAFSKEKIDEYEQESISNIGDEGKGTLRVEDDSDTTRIESIEDDGSILVVSEGKLGYISMDVKLDNDDMIRIVEILVKKLNKFKNLLESLK